MNTITEPTIEEIAAADAAKQPAGTPPAYQPPEAGTVAVREGTVVTRPGRRKPQPIDGALLWALTRRYLCHYVAFTSEAQATLVTAWVFHAMARDRDDTGMGPLIWRATPRLLITSKKRRSGKSTVLDLLAILTGSRRGKMPKVTPARIAQVLSKYHETAVIDEAKTIFGAGAGHIELQGCLLAGYTRKSSYEVSGTSLSLFGPVALAAKENLITDTRTDTMGDLLDRCLKIVLDSPLFPMPEMGERADGDGELLHRALVAWTDANRAELKAAAADLADEDYAEAQQLVKDNPRAAAEMNWRLIQIGRPLRACGRVAGPGAEADVVAALDELTEGTASAEARAALAEMERRADAWGDSFTEDEVPEGGRVVFGGDDEHDLASLAASLPAPAPPARAGNDYPSGSPAPAPVANWAAVRVTSANGDPPAAELIGDQHADMTAAMAACQAGTSEPLPWIAGNRPDSWTATIRPEPGTEVSYAVSAAVK